MLRSSYCNFLRSFQILLFLTNYIQMTSWIRHEKNTPFMEFSVNGKKQSRNLSYRILVIISIGLLRSSYFNFLGSIQIVLFLTNSFQIPSLYRHEKLTPFVELSVNGKKTWKSCIQFFRHYFICFATVKLLQFLTSISDPSNLNKFCSNAFLNRHEEVTPFMVFIVNGKKNIKKFHTNFSSLFQLHCYGQVTSISYVQFR